MKISLQQLTGNLKAKLASFYWVAGDEPLLVQEACDQIREAARQQGFLDRQVFHADAQMNWQALEMETSAMSLFANPRRLEVHLPNGKLTGGEAWLTQVCENPPEDILILLISPRLETNEARKKWAKLAESKAIYVQIWPIERTEFPRWLKQRADQRGLKLTEAALELLVDRLEGNLLAAQQEIERLHLLAGDQLVDEMQVQSAVLDSARFNAFDFVGDLFAGKTAHALRTLAVLEQEDVSPLLLLNNLSRDLRLALDLHCHLAEGKPAQSFFSSRFIRVKSQVQSLERLTRRVKTPALRAALKHCSDIDRACKGFDDRSPWLLLQQLPLLLI